MNQFLKDIRSTPIFWLGIFIPIVIIMEFTHNGSHTTIFILSILAIVPLAGFLSHATAMVMLSYFIAPVPMDLDFKGGLIFMLFFGTLTIALTSNSW